MTLRRAAKPRLSRLRRLSNDHSALNITPKGGELCDMENAISDDYIVQLYSENGMSQNDISRLFDINLKHIRNILKQAGFDTSRYRRIPAKDEEVISILLLAGVTFRAAGEATDISFHVIRDIAERLPDRSARRIYKAPKFTVTKREETFLSRFLSGESFCRICTSMHLSNEEILRCFSMLDNYALHQHSAALCRSLKAEDMNLNTVTSLARKYGISTSVVKAHLNI